MVLFLASMAGGSSKTGKADEGRGTDAGGDRQLRVHARLLPEALSPAPAAGKAGPGKRIRVKRSFQERLLRNSALACGILLGILALGNLNAPWAQRASESIEQALTMEIDLDQSLGQLRFVQNLMPESALVFFDLSDRSGMCRPTEAEVSHAYSEGQPWLMFDCGDGTAVYAAAEGMVAAVSRLDDGSWGVLIDHGDGLESVSACLTSVDVESGDRVTGGDKIGMAEDELFFELRQDGTAVDPTERLGL